MSAGLDPVELAQALIRRASVTPRDEGAIALLADRLEALGFTCHLLPFRTEGEPEIANLYARIGQGAPVLCFAGHTDVVPAGREAAWSVDPFGGTIRDGALFGRGAVDMKGGIAAFVGAVARFLERRSRAFGGSIAFLITGDEEGPSLDGTVKLLEWLSDRGEALDACVVGEPTSDAVIGDTIKIGRRGSMNGELKVKGIAGHTAYPHLADNPAHRLTLMLADLVQTPIDTATEHFAASSLQISSIDIGNPATNVIPGQARASFNIRFNDRWTGAAIDALLRQRLGPHGGDWTLETSVSGEAFLVAPGPFADLVRTATESVTGHRPVYSTSGGTSDARFIHKYCPVAELGLRNATAHKTDEAVPLADLAMLGRIYEAILDRYFAIPGS